MKKILITTAGSPGGENLIRSIKKSAFKAILYGSNCDENLLAKSSADFLVWLPNADSINYIDSLSKVVKKYSIELVIPNSDLEVGRISRDRHMLPCLLFLPTNQTVEICQDKFKMYYLLKEASIPVAETYALTGYTDISDFMRKFPAEKFWLRTKRGAGSIAATWVNTEEQARAWIKLWVELRGFSITDFTISEFLPGRDYAFQSVWKNGRLLVAKLAERLVYYMGRHRLSNMSSTPAVARTIRDNEALETIIRAIKVVSNCPHGNFNLDLKGNDKGDMCITEFNIGRFMNITPIHDLTGKYNTAEIYLQAAFNLIEELEEPIDIEEGMYLLRELDTEPLIISEKQLNQKIRDAKQYIEG